MQTRLKRWLFLIHRWLGIVACLFFAMWFVSGVVMMYVGYPKLTERERLLHLPALNAQAPLLAPEEALKKADAQGPFEELKLANARGGQPVYTAIPAPQQLAGQVGKKGRPEPIIIDARSGQRLSGTDRNLVMASAAAYAGPSITASYVDAIGEDAFTHSRALDAHRPLHRVQLNDQDGTLLYISGRTGEVVRDATRNERIWNYVGAWIHWLYPLRGNVFDAWWTDTVIWLSIGGTVVALTGTVVGILRWRFTKPYRSGSRSPYQRGLMRWHHLFGLSFAVITITWIFSGLMSMNPWRIFDSGAASLQTGLMHGSSLAKTELDTRPQTLLQAIGGPVSELRWNRRLGRNIVTAHGAAGMSVVLDGRTAQPYAPDREVLIAASRHLMPYPIKAVHQLDRYDLYYYAREEHTMTGGGEKPLPVIRVIFDDPAATWVHIDPHTGAILGKTDSHRRASRWLFAMLHSWDWLPLLERRPLWDILLVALSLGGGILSITGVVIGWRRIDRKLGAGGRHA
ncbi:hypothetical protein GCM10007205_05900 [Oxalicibacterium flavum]|uniref:Peptidase n=1 Tax=Oxalicibacterium flavum TaxID=179467 RepID=A0A8J2XYL5_9BURK|nr:PepSY domain-containing protein [Oxalicibacterium flavum]GGB99400.1 hypothetical protein GCM10007205_05900 [Oxalicibacterium flavum]